MDSDTITIKGQEVFIKEEVPEKGVKAADFRFVKEDLSEGQLSDYEGKVRLLIGVPSLDTGICAKETKTFSEKLSKKKDVVAIVVSQDLPFAMKHFCQANKVDNMVVASDFRYKDFIHQYNTEMINGPLKGLSARVVFVLDKDGTIQHTQLVQEVLNEPDYDAALKAVEELT